MKDVAKSGTGLAFEAYPDLVTRLPLMTLMILMTGCVPVISVSDKSVIYHEISQTILVLFCRYIDVYVLLIFRSALLTGIYPYKLGRYQIQSFET